MQVSTAGPAEALQLPGGSPEESHGALDTHQSEDQEQTAGSAARGGSVTAVSRSGG